MKNILFFIPLIGLLNYHNCPYELKFKAGMFHLFTAITLAAYLILK